MRRRLLLSIFIAIVISCLAGCMRPDVRSIRDGMLKQGLSMSAFQETWGQPDRTSVVSGNEEEITAKWGSFGGGFFKGRRSYQMWDYENFGIILLFDDDELVNWQTNKTTEELKALSKP